MKVRKFQTAGIIPYALKEESMPEVEWTAAYREQQQREREAYERDMSQPYYKLHDKPTFEQWQQQNQIRQQNQGVIRQAENVSAPVDAINQYIREFKYDMANGKIPKGKYTLPATLLASAGGAGFAAAPISFIAGGAGAEIGGKAFDFGTKLVTGKSWTDKVNDWTGLDKEAAAITNPGLIIGGGLGIKGLNMTKQRVLDAAYNNFTPLGYTDSGKLPFMSHKQELKDMIKEFFTPKRINTSTDVYPKWYQRAIQYGKQHPEQGGIQQIDFEPMLKFRDEAWRLATNQKSRLGLYKANGDGTYSYDMDIVEQIGRRRPLELFVKPYSESSGVTTDQITSNGGYMGIKLGPYKVSGSLYSGTEYAGKPSFSIEDVWDLQPFKDEQRTFFPLITKLGKEYPRIFGKLRNIEVLKPLNGNPFKVKQTFPEGTANIHLYPNLMIPK